MSSTEASNNREKIKVKLKSRHGFFYDEDLKKKQFCVSPQLYHINYRQTSNLRFSQLSFGKGTKHHYLDSRKSYPGPGSYNLPSIFDKSLRTKPALN